MIHLTFLMIFNILRKKKKAHKYRYVRALSGVDSNGEAKQLSVTDSDETAEDTEEALSKSLPLAVAASVSAAAAFVNT